MPQYRISVVKKGPNGPENFFTAKNISSESRAIGVYWELRRAFTEEGGFLVCVPVRFDTVGTEISVERGN